MDRNIPCVVKAASRDSLGALERFLVGHTAGRVTVSIQCGSAEMARLMAERLETLTLKRVGSDLKLHVDIPKGVECNDGAVKGVALSVIESLPIRFQRVVRGGGCCRGGLG